MVRTPLLLGDRLLRRGGRQQRRRRRQQRVHQTGVRGMRTVQHLRQRLEQLLGRAVGEEVRKSGRVQQARSYRSVRRWNCCKRNLFALEQSHDESIRTVNLLVLLGVLSKFGCAIACRFARDVVTT